MLRSSLWMTATEWWETIIRENEKLSVVRSLRKFHQLLPWMWRRYSGYFLCLWICILGRIETVLLWQAEGTACSWTSSTPRLRHKNAERWRRDRQWYRDISRRNASTAWRTISVFRKISLFFGVELIHKHLFSQVCFGSLFWPPVPEYLDELIESLIEKKSPFVCLLELLFAQYLWFIPPT